MSIFTKWISLIALLSLVSQNSFGADRPWEVLFNGEDVSGWRGFRQPDFPITGWRIEGTSLCHIAHTAGGDLVTRKEYASFELELDWAISEGGNSGILYRVSEESAFSWQSGLEMQILDDLSHPDGHNPLTSAGGLYGLLAPKEKRLAPLGQYNHARLVVAGNHVEHWLNGSLLLSYELNSSDWLDLVATSKFRDFPLFGGLPRGRIALQEHWDGACFKNIRLREL